MTTFDYNTFSIVGFSPVRGEYQFIANNTPTAAMVSDLDSSTDSFWFGGPLTTTSTGAETFLVR